MSNKKRVQWGTVSIMEFRVGYTPCTVPESGGPPIGLIGKAISQNIIQLNEEKSTFHQVHTRRSSEFWLNPMERAQILQIENGFRLDEIAIVCRDVFTSLNARKFSQLDEVVRQVLENHEVDTMNQLEILPTNTFQDTRKKIVLY